MKLTVGLKLKPTSAQAKALRATLELANQAANEISRIAWDRQTFGQFQIHKLAYKATREKYSLSAQVVVRLIAKVADAYKLDRKKQRVFREAGSIAYDDRILKCKSDSVSIWTTDGRQEIAFSCGESQRKLLESRQGESDLVLRKGKWFLFATVNAIEPQMNEPDGFLGVDFGIARVASDSDGRSFTGAHIRNLRKRHGKIRARLQSKGTKSAKRLLQQRNRKEANFARNLNHSISKQIVDEAQRTNRGIAIEDLKGIRARVRASRKQRRELHSWSFGQLRAFVEYKAKLAGVEVKTVDARNSSRECSECGHISKSNRRSQSKFQCRACGYTRNADINAARVIASRATVNKPIAGTIVTRKLHLKRVSV